MRVIVCHTKCWGNAEKSLSRSGICGFEVECLVVGTQIDMNMKRDHDSANTIYTMWEPTVHKISF